MSGDPATFLFSVDLEDVRAMIPDGDLYEDRLESSAESILSFLDEEGLRCTFFTTGDVADRYPSLIARIAGEGHELGLHTTRHVSLDRQDPASLRADLERNVAAIRATVDAPILGFRAPTFSLTAETVWAYEVLAEIGLTYSSSVLPAANPLFGWPGHDSAPGLTESGIWEIPVTLTGNRLLNVPFAGGVYLRVLPFRWIRHSFLRTLADRRPVVGYLHPYDVDTGQERFMHPGLGGRVLYNRLMYVNRSGALTRLRRLLEARARVVPYADYVREELSPTIE